MGWGPTLLPRFLCGGGASQGQRELPTQASQPWLLAHNPQEAGEGQQGFSWQGEGPHFAGEPEVLKRRHRGRGLRGVD